MCLLMGCLVFFLCAGWPGLIAFFLGILVLKALSK